MAHNKIEQGDRNEKYEKPKVKSKKSRPSGTGWSPCTVCDQTGEHDDKTCKVCKGRGWVAEG